MLIRRKKMRCPGERPDCSHCVRLNQTCQYTEKSANESTQHFSTSHEMMAQKLAELEKRLDTMQDRPK